MIVTIRLYRDSIPVLLFLIPYSPPLSDYGYAQICALTLSVSLDTWKSGHRGDRWRQSRGEEAAEWTSHESLLCVLNASTIQESTYGFEISGWVYWLVCGVSAEGDRVRGLCSDLSMFLRRSDTCTLPLTMRAQARYRLCFGSARISWWSLLKASLNIWSSL